jgi:hypothetical protein
VVVVKIVRLAAPVIPMEALHNRVKLSKKSSYLTYYSLYTGTSPWWWLKLSALLAAPVVPMEALHNIGLSLVQI